MFDDAVANGRELVLRERLHNADGIFADVTRELRRAENRGLRRRQREDAVRIRQIVDALRQPADPPRVEQTRALLVETIEIELKIPGPFDEEWPPFGEEGFERGQVHDGGVGFDLSEV